MYVYFHPYLGKIPILTNIFQMGWNHQPVNKGFLGIQTTNLPLVDCSMPGKNKNLLPQMVVKNGDFHPMGSNPLKITN